MNPEFNMQHPYYTVFKDQMGQQINKENCSMVERLDPLFSVLAHNKADDVPAGQISKHKPEYDSMGQKFWITHDLDFDEVPDINANSIGKSMTVMPTSYPKFITADKYTKAKYPMAYFQEAIGFTVAELKLLSNGKSGGIIKKKINSVMGAWKRALADQVQSSQNATETRLLGTGYIMSNANNVGGINQADYEKWRPGLLDLSTSGTFTWQKLDSDLGVFETLSDPEGRAIIPDLVLLATGGGHNLKVAFDQSIAQNNRIVDTEFRDKFGFAPTVFGSSRIIGDPRAIAQSVTFYTTKHWHVVGDLMPTLGDLKDLPGVEPKYMNVVQMAGLSCDFILAQGRKVGYTA